MAESRTYGYIRVSSKDQNEVRQMIALRQWSLITKTIKADIFVLDMPLLDTRKRGNDLTGTFIADLVLQILSYVAQSERDAIKQRQAEGIAAAKANGVWLGRRPIELPENFAEVCRAYQAGELTMRAAAQSVSMSVTTFYRRYKEQMMDAIK